ncbi:hypothetical protein Lser_V15G12622 [Lactuca serriola]
MDDSQSNPINISNSIGSTTKIPILYTQDYEVWAHHFEDYVIGSEDNGYLIWEAIVSGPFSHSGTSRIIKTQKEYNDLLKDVKDVAQDEKEKFHCNIKALRLIRFALQSDMFRLVSSCSTAKEIWDQLRELYSTDEDLEHSIQTLLLSEFGEFKQNSDESVTQTFDRFNHLLSKMIKHDIERKLIEQKVTFLNGLRSEWRTVVSTVKAHEQFKSYSLVKLVGILKSQEKIVMQEKSVVSNLGSLALLSKSKNVVKDEDLNLEDYDLTSEDYAMMVSNPNRFIKKRFPTNKNRNWQGSYSSEKVREEPKSEEPKKEAKVEGDSGVSCYYCGGKNHYAKDCVLKKMAEKDEEKDEEAILMKKLEEIKRKKAATNPSMNALIVQGSAEDDEFGGVQVWSTDSKDDEVRKPSHGKAYVARDGESSGKCLMVTEVSHMRGYNTDGGNEDTKEVLSKRQKIHRMILPFLEFKEDEIDTEAYNCESVVSSDDVNPTYMYGLDKIESFIKSKDHKDMLKNLLDENDKLKLRTKTIQKLDSLSANLSSENKIDVENASELNEDDDMSEISVEVEVDCFEFVKSEPENHKNLISENSMEFARLSKNKSAVLKEKALVFQKVRTTPNQVYKVTGVTEHQTAELTAIVNEDNADDGTKEISVEEVNSTSETSSTKSEPTVKKLKQKDNIHRQPKQVKNQKQQRNLRYKKNLSEFWRTQNTHFSYHDRNSKSKKKAFGPHEEQNRKDRFGPESNINLKGRFGHEGKSYRSSRFGPSNDQKQKGHLEPQVRKNSQSKFTHSNSSHSQFSSKPYSVPTQNSKSSTNLSLRRMILPFLEFKEDEIDAEAYNYESVVSSDDVNPTYMYGLDKIESFIKSKDHKDMLKNLLDENDKLKLRTKTIQKFDSLSANLSSENKIDVENASELNEDDDMSEISVEVEVDCFEFVKSEPENHKNLISENSVEFARLSKNKSPVLKEKALVFQKVRTTPNQVYKVTGVTEHQTAELTAIVNEDNADGCDEFFWSAPIDNANETPLNKPDNFDVPSTSGTKEISVEEVNSTSETSSTKSEPTVKKLKQKANIHRQPKQVKNQKQQRNLRYKKNLSEFWRTQNTHFSYHDRNSKSKKKAFGPHEEQNRKDRFGPESNSNLKGTFGHEGKNYRSSRFGPSNDQKQKGHLEPQVRKNSQSKFTHSNSSHSQFSSKPYSVPTQNSKSSTNLSLRRMILPFLEFKEDEIDAEAYNCESVVSSDDVNPTYMYGLDKIESFIKSKDHKDMLKNLLDENDKLKLRTKTIQKFDSLSANLSSENKIDVENASELNEDDDMSEISVEVEVDCFEFVKSEPENHKNLISENSVEFARLSKNKSPVLKEKALVFQKVRTTPNQVYKVTGVTEHQTAELTAIVNEDNADGCDEFFWSAPIDNANETPLNKPDNFDVPSTSGTKEISVEEVNSTSETSSTKSEPTVKKLKQKTNIHRQPKQVKNQKQQRNLRYKKNLSEFWRTQNTHFSYHDRNSKSKKKAFGPHEEQNRKDRFGPESNNNLKGRFGHEGKSYRSSRFGPSNDQKQKGHLEPQVRKNSQSKFTHSNSSHSQFSSKPYSVPTQNSKSSTNLSLRRMILPFLEFKEDEIDAEAYNCESVVSSDDVNPTYMYGLDKIESFIKSKDHKDMLKNLLDENDKLKLRTKTIQKFDSLSANLSSENKIDVENASELNEDDDMSEISVEVEVDCFEFVKSEPENHKNLISENSVEFARLSKNKSPVLKEKALVFQKVRTTPNQVYKVTRVTEHQTAELTAIVNEDNADGCDEFFWSAPIDNANETPLNKPDNFDVPSTSGTKEISVEEVNSTSETSSTKSEPTVKKLKQKANIHRQPKQVKNQKQQRNLRYKKNLSEFWRTQNTHFSYHDRNSKSKKKAFGPHEEQNRKDRFGPESNNNLKGRFGHEGKSYRSSRFGPSNDQKQKGHLEPQVRKNSQSKFTHSNSSHSQFSSKPYSVPTQNSKSSTNLSLRRMILPFLEFKEDEIDAEAYNCESVVSSDDVNPTYMYGLDKIESFIKSKDHKDMLKNLLDENDKLKLRTKTIQKFDSLSANLSSENKIDVENASELNEDDDMSEISVEVEVDCFEFVKSEPENHKNLISENSVEFARLSKNKSPVLKEKALVFQKVRTTPNQVYKVTRVTEHQTAELTAIVNEDNADGCDEFFWSAPIDNANETPLKKPDNFDVPSTSGTKEISVEEVNSTSETSSTKSEPTVKKLKQKANIHRQPKQVKNQKQQRNLRFKKNLSEFWRTQNTHFSYHDRNSKSKKKAFGPHEEQNRKDRFGPESNNNLKGRFGHEGKSYRSSRFGPSNDQKQKGHLEPQVRKNSQSKFTHSNSSHSQFSSKPYSVPTQNSKSSTNLSLRRMILPFLEFKEDEIDAEAYNCESVVSSDDVNPTYMYGLDKIESFIKSKDHKDMLKNLLDENDKLKLRTKTIQKFDSLSANLSSENKIDVENASELNEDDDMSEISVEVEVDCFEFVKSEPENHKNLISENSVEFARLSKNKSPVLKEKALVFQKVRTTPNQVYKVTGVTEHQTAELTAIVNEDNADGCDEFFWSAPIDNANETPLNKPDNFDVPSTSGTKEISVEEVNSTSETSSTKSEPTVKKLKQKTNIHRQPKQVKNQKQQRNLRYKKNLSEFWRTQNTHFSYHDRNSKSKKKAFGPHEEQNRKDRFGPESNNNLKGRFGHEGKSYRSSRFGPSNDQKQKGHLEPQVRKNSQSKFTHSNSSHSQFSSKPYSVPTQNSKSSTNLSLRRMILPFLEFKEDEIDAEAYNCESVVSSDDVNPTYMYGLDKIESFIKSKDHKDMLKNLLDENDKLKLRTKTIQKFDSLSANLSSENKIDVENASELNEDDDMSEISVEVEVDCFEFVKSEPENHKNLISENSVEFARLSKNKSPVLKEKALVFQKVRTTPNQVYKVTRVTEHQTAELTAIVNEDNADGCDEFFWSAPIDNANETPLNKPDNFDVPSTSGTKEISVEEVNSTSETSSTKSEPTVKKLKQKANIHRQPKQVKNQKQQRNLRYKKNLSEFWRTQNTHFSYHDRNSKSKKKAFGPHEEQNRKDRFGPESNSNLKGRFGHEGKSYRSSRFGPSNDQKQKGHLEPQVRKNSQSKFTHSNSSHSQFSSKPYSVPTQNSKSSTNLSLRRMILPFLEFKEDEIDAEAYNCESVVSSDDVNPTYMYGLDKIESFIKSKDHKDMLKNLLDENDKLKLRTKTIQKFDSLSANLSSENKIDVENASELNEDDDMSEISVEVEVDCFEFVKSEPENHKNLISENSMEFARLSKNKSPVLKEKALVFQKVRTTPNQVYKVTRVTEHQTAELTAIVNEDNADGCDEFFWSTPIDNANETPLKKPDNFDVPSTSGTKEISIEEVNSTSETSSTKSEPTVKKLKQKANIHRQPKQVKNQKQQRNLRYKKNLSEFWRTQNTHFSYHDRNSKSKKKAFGPHEEQNRKDRFGPESNSNLKGRFGHEGKSYRSSRFGPSNDQKQKGHLEPQVRKNSQSKFTHSNSSHSQFSSKPYSVPTQNSKSSTNLSLRRMILPFLEFKEDEIDAEAYNCESVVSSDDVNPTYMYGLDKIESFIKSKDHKDMLKNLLDENDKLKLRTKTIQKFDSLSANLSSENKIDVENASELNEDDDMSEISVEVEVDCFEFVKSEPENHKNLISENSMEFARLSKNKSPVLKEKALVFQKVRTTPNQVYKVTRVTEHQTAELTAIVNEDNADGCDEFFWSTPIDNANETPLKKPDNFDVPSTSGTKEISIEEVNSTSETSSTKSEPTVKKLKQKANIHRQPKQVKNQKQQRNLRYKKNLSEFWRTQNTHFSYHDRNSKSKKKAFGPHEEQNRKDRFGPESNSNLKGRFGHEGKSYRSSRFGPSNDQKQKGHLEPQVRKNSQSKFTHSNSSHSQFSSKPYSVPTQNSKSSTNLSLRRMILPFLEFKEDEIDAEAYNCESVVSSDDVNPTYMYGLDKIESFIKSKDHKDMLKNLLDENDKLKLRTKTIQKFDSLSANLSSENKIDVENASELNEDDDMSEISVEVEVDCFEFVKSEPENHKNLISENSVEFARLSKNKSPVLKEKALVFQKVRTTPNQVYKVTGVTEHQTAELTAIVNEDNADGCDEFFWSAPIDNANETPLNKPDNFDVPSTSGTKEISAEEVNSTSETSSTKSEPTVKKLKQKTNIHRQPKQVKNQKQQRNLRYKKNLSEFWRTQNTHFSYHDRNSKSKKKAFGPHEEQNRKDRFGPESNSNLKGRFGHEGKSYRSSRFGPSNDQKQKGHLEPQVRKNSQSKFTHSNSSHSQFSSKPYSVPTQNSKSSTNLSLRRMILPFLEFKEDEIDAEAYNCESVVSSDDVNPTYMYGLDKIESFIKSKDHKDMLKNLLDENDKLKLRTKTIQKFDSLSANLSSENKIDVENASELNEDDDMSEISVEVEVDCFEFVKSEPENHKNLISENSVEFARLSKNKSPVLKEKALVFQKVRTTPNQVYKVTGVTEHQTAELTAIVNEDNADGCDEFFWSAPIDNANETPLNKPDNFDVPSTSGTKEISVEEVNSTSETSSTKSEPTVKKLKQKTNIHRQPKQVKNQKQQRNLRYKKNLSEFWRTQNTHFSYHDRNSKSKKKAFGPHEEQNRKDRFGPESNSNLKGRFGHEGKSYRSSRFGPSNDQKQKGHLEPQVRKNSQSKFTHSNSSHSQFSSKPYSVPTQNSKSSTNLSLRRMILPFLEFKEDEIDAEAYNCESVVSSDDVNPTYMYGLDKIESFIKSKDHKDMLKNLLDENDKLKLRTKTIQKFDSLSANLSSENKIDVENASELNEDDDMSEISVEVEVDCFEFVKSEPENHKNLISENSVEFARLSKNKSPVLKEKALVFQKVRTTPNQVYKVTRVTEHQTAELTAIVNEDNADGCDEFFWSAPIDNANETPLNKPDNFDVPSTSGTKEISVEEVNSTSETSSTKSEPTVKKLKQKANIHRQPKQVKNQKQQRNLRYKKNLSEFWRTQNTHFSYHDRNSKSKKKAFGPHEEQNRKDRFGPESNSNLKGRFGHEGKSYRSSRFGPSNDQKQKGHLEPQVRKNSQSKFTHSNSSHSQFSSKPYSVPTQNSKSSTNLSLRRMILPFLEFKEDEIDAEAYNCESVVSSDDVNPTYMYGLDKIESFIKSKDHKDMLKNLLDENDKLKLRTKTIQKFDSLSANLSSENKIDVENASELNEDDDMSEISVEVEVDCFEFVKSEPENHKNLISENSVEFARLSKNKSPVLKEKALVFQKVRTTPNQVYKVTRVTEHQTAELTAIVNEDNADGCDEFFWSAPIDNANETVGLSE